MHKIGDVMSIFRSVQRIPQGALYLTNFQLFWISYSGEVFLLSLAFLNKEKSLLSHSSSYLISQPLSPSSLPPYPGLDQHALWLHLCHQETQKSAYKGRRNHRQIAVSRHQRQGCKMCATHIATRLQALSCSCAWIFRGCYCPSLHQ